MGRDAKTPAQKKSERARTVFDAAERSFVA
jgi:hypothetical protein